MHSKPPSAREYKNRVVPKACRRLGKKGIEYDVGPRAEFLGMGSVLNKEPLIWFGEQARRICRKRTSGVNKIQK